MKKTNLFAIVAAIGVLSGCGYERVEAGHVGVLVNLYGDDKGVKAEELGPGGYWTSWGEDIYKFPTYNVNYSWTAKDDESGGNEEIPVGLKGGSKVFVDVGITYSIQPDKADQLFQSYRKGVEEITDTVIYKEVKEVLNETAAGMTPEQIYDTGKVSLFNTAEQKIKERFEPQGILVSDLQMLDIRYDPRMEEAIKMAALATQRAQQVENELRQTEAEAKKAIAKAEADAKVSLAQANAEAGAKVARARADADAEIARADAAARTTRMQGEAQAAANIALGRSITPSLIEYKRAEAEAVKAAQWKGNLPEVVVGGDANAIMDLRGLTRK